ncbi:SpoIIE family protein phosphatase [Alloacidobacterium dinghuense]|uniref:SpoIIE family protein phosphatase n=1 Tax=Alloacidobacterium dinghuense TaxID=2763107 RepID=A0A7G8BKE6_9BACT|nr:SpoIIE family protein phosphatase [Alloacidobacterium dinghuense]QNI33016.1 SpoIIE family protein phosphatase [Alloacidobacterium dinghuense]
MGQVRNFEARVFRALHREPPQSKVHRLAFWLLIIYLALIPERLLPGNAGAFFQWVSFFILLLLLAFCIPLVWRWIFGRFLWKLRNRLIVNYLLMGLTPVVLFVLLALIALYGFSGQFAIFAAASAIDAQMERYGAENRAFCVHVAHFLATHPGSKTISPPPELESTAPGKGDANLRLAAFQDGKAIPIVPAELQADIPEVPSWAQNHFRSAVLDNGRLYLRAINMQTVDGHTTTVITSALVDKAGLDEAAHGIGRIEVLPNLPMSEETSAGGEQARVVLSKPSPPGIKAKINQHELTREEIRASSITGGTLPSAQSFYDIPITFYAPLGTTDWATGKTHNTPTIVTSRPSLLYQRLFITSLQIATVVQDILIAIAAFFAVLELIAFIMAVRLNRTITRSVNDLYDATIEIDQGNLVHRIKVTRNDQLAALSRSFNRMSYSLERLLAEQREKERLQGELAIAQEVQANLFPQGAISLPMLELHGACYPARTVSGDYYDFLTFDDSSLGLALGDISGKGISAALLMATLHSAVRAYRYAGEEMVSVGNQFSAMAAEKIGAINGSNGNSNGSDPFLKPARILAQLNRHLYRSTQPEKYATLFLAHYDGHTSQLTYSCGGQLPPLILRCDNSVTQLGCGGTVVGLLENPSYDQGVERLMSGDILIAYSDGVTEPENDFGEFGEDRLIDVVRRHRHMPLDAISEQVMQSLRNWIGGQEQPDDITLVLARQR